MAPSSGPKGISRGSATSFASGEATLLALAVIPVLGFAVYQLMRQGLVAGASMPSELFFGLIVADANMLDYSLYIAGALTLALAGFGIYWSKFRTTVTTIKPKPSKGDGETEEKPKIGKKTKKPSSLRELKGGNWGKLDITIARKSTQL